jgi:hypothetical protein
MNVVGLDLERLDLDSGEVILARVCRERYAYDLRYFQPLIAAVTA